MLDAQIAGGLALSVASALTLNWAYVQEHGAANTLPPLSLRNPVRSVRLLLSSREWLRGAAAEATGFTLYVIALAMAPLSLVQSVSAGGIAVLAYMSAHRSRRATTPRERLGVGLSLLGLIALAISLTESVSHESSASVASLAVWLGSCGVVAAGALIASGRFGRGVPYAIAAGTLLACGDVSMKGAFEGHWHLIFLATAAIGYGVGTILLQIAYQHAAVLTAAGISTLLINSLPIVAATTILGEQVPDGILGVLRVAAFALLIAGAVALARGEPEDEASTAVPARANGGIEGG
jgi:hypothetical protein